MEKISEQIKKAGQSKILVRVLFVLGVAIIVKIVFIAGVLVGFHKASYGQVRGKDDDNNFTLGHRTVRLAGMQIAGMMDNLPNSHGATGKIIKIELPNIFVQGRDNTEKVVLIDSNTRIQKGGVDITPADLIINDSVILIGTPDSQGVIEAKLIRVI